MKSPRRRWLIEAILGLVMIPLTAVPIWLYVAHTDDGYLMYLRGRYALAAPDTPGLEDEQYRLALEARRRLREIHGVPVLVYHGIGRIGADDAGGRFVLTRERFAEQMASLRAAGYEPVTTDQLALYLSADPASDDIPEAEVLKLPPKPILITFDDGRADAMIQADPILEDTRMRATMFVIGKPTETGSFYYESAEKLRENVRSGRWELQNHTYDLHDFVQTQGGRLSALVAPNPGESITGYARRIGSDLDRAQALLHRITGQRAVAFAYPFGEWGAEAAPGVEDALAEVLQARVELAFDQDGQDAWRPSLPGDDRLHLHRLEVANWSGAELLSLLEAGAARAAAVYDERGLGYRYSELELSLARQRTTCAQPRNAPVHERDDLSGERLVALTFNGGPSTFTPGVIDVLSRYNAQATFFVHGSQVPGHERLLRRMLVEGNEIANGTFDGVDLATLGDEDVEQQLDDTTKAIRAATGDDPCLARPPFGSDAERVAAIAGKRDLTTALWSVDPSDYETASSTEVAGRVLSRVEPGDIVVLHDGGDDQRQVTLEALPTIVEGLLAQGYRLVTVSDLLSWTPPECEACSPREIDGSPVLVSKDASTRGHESAFTRSETTTVQGGLVSSTSGAGGNGNGAGRPSGGGHGPGASPGSHTHPQPAAGNPPQAPGQDPSPSPPADDQPGQGSDHHSADPPTTGGTGGGGTGGGGGGGSGGGSSGGGGSGAGTGGGGSAGGGTGGGGNSGGGTVGGGSGSGGSGGGTPSDPGESAPPGQGGTPPGQGGTPPGQGGTPPGQEGKPPKHDGTPPGHDRYAPVHGPAALVEAPPFKPR